MRWGDSIPAKEGQAGAGPGDESAILVAEDQPDARATEVMILNDLGYRTYEAGDGVEALAMALKRGNRVGLVLAAFSLPGINGLELARRLAEEAPAVRVILLVDDPEERRGLEVPPNVRGVMLKPFDLETLAEMVRQAMVGIGDWGSGIGRGAGLGEGTGGTDGRN